MTVWRGSERGGGYRFKGGSLPSAVLTVPSSGSARRRRGAGSRGACRQPELTPRPEQLCKGRRSASHHLPLAQCAGRGEGDGTPPRTCSLRETGRHVYHAPASRFIPPLPSHRGITRWRGDRSHCTMGGTRAHFQADTRSVARASLSVPPDPEER